MHHCSYGHDFDFLPTEVRQAIEAESYRAFMGQQATDNTPVPDGVPVREDTPDALHQELATAALRVPRPLAETTHRLLATATFSAYTRGNHRLSERLAHEAASWCNTQWARLADENPLADEELSLRTLESCRTLADARDALPPPHRATLLAAAKRVLAEDGRGDRPDSPTAAPSTPSTAIGTSTARRVETRARIATIAETWRAAIRTEREEYQTRELGRSLGGFVREIGEMLPRLSRAQSVVHDLFGTDDALWDQSFAEWSATAWDALESYAERLAEMPELGRLAAVIGRSKVASELIATTRVLREVRMRPVGLGKSEVTGVCFGDDLSSLLPSEVALLADPATEDLFYAKLAHKELLQLDYRRERMVEETRVTSVPMTERVLVPRGPVIACVDTSGSMLGDPEQVAKAMTLALARRLGDDGRDIHVIAFSTAIRTLTLPATHLDLAGLCEFLGGSFHGGTDLRPALAESLNVLQTGAFRHADVLVVSDFKIPKIADRFIDAIKREQHNGTLFHSLTIAGAPVKDPLHIFDNSWHFDIREVSRGIRPDTLRFLG